jgi:GT2 family glycosyltransferase
MISIITVSHGHEIYIRKLLDSLEEFMTLEFEIILIDNLSSRGQLVDIVQKYNIDITLIINVKQYSFSRNNNIGISCAKYTNVMLLNPDTWLVDTALNDFLLGVVLKNKCLYFPRLMNKDGTEQIHCKKKPSIINQFSTLTKIIFGKKASSPKGDYWCMAAALIINKNDFYVLGGFDENFSLYGEDTELCDRARKRGYEIKILKNVEVFHMLHDQSKSKYILRVFLSAIYYRVKSLYNSYC